MNYVYHYIELKKKQRENLYIVQLLLKVFRLYFYFKKSSYLTKHLSVLKYRPFRALLLI